MTLPERDALGVDCGVPLLEPVPLALAPCESVVVGVPLIEVERESVDAADSLTLLV